MEFSGGVKHRSGLTDMVLVESVYGTKSMQEPDMFDSLRGNNDGYHLGNERAVMSKEKCNRCGAPLGTETKKTKQRFCPNCKRKFQLQKY